MRSTGGLQVPARRAGPVVAGAAGGAFAVSVVGGYQLHWAWTGFSDNTTVWDWLQLLVLPAVLTALPFWYRTRGDRRAWRIAAGGLAGGGLVLIAASYTFDWAWTGFRGRTLWDWLELLVLPVVLAFLPLWLATRRTMHPRWRMAALALVVAFAVCVIGGYGLGWAWTGFSGNTLWDWLHLLLVPFLLPAGLAWMSVRLREEEDSAQREAASIPAAAVGD
jgi:heme/copper-type cytochrome/quinol oxidase subunit 4